MNTTVYNTSEDDWTHSSEAIEEALLQRVEDMSEEEILSTDTITLYKGEACQKTFEDFLCVGYILEEMQNMAYDNIGDFAQDYLDNVTPTQKQELHDLIVDWSERHNLQPNFSEVINIEEVEVALTKEIKDSVL